MKTKLFLFLIYLSTNVYAEVTFQKHFVNDPPEAVGSVHSVDIDGDNDMDVLSASPFDNRIAWYENVDGQGTFRLQHIITSNANRARDVYAADIDGDGDMDVLSASAGDNKIAWYENLDGLGGFGVEKVITQTAIGASSVHAADLDGDGDMDVLSTSFIGNQLAWYRNDGKGNFGSPLNIAFNALGATSVYAADIDGDSDLDILTNFSDSDTIVWYENTDGAGNFSVQREITTVADNVISVHASDMDGDGDIDVLSAAFGNRTINWYENDGKGIFGTTHIVTGEAGGAFSVYAADFDNDGDSDIVSAAFSDNRIAWHENTDGQGTFGEQQTLALNHPDFDMANEARSVYASDIDGDGNIDIISASSSSDKIAWYKNTGQGGFGRQQIITSIVDSESVETVDIDGDGDLDVLTPLAWHENIDGQGTFGTPQAIIHAKGVILKSAHTNDIDGDGDADVLSTSFWTGVIAWYENTDGKGNFSQEKIITTDMDRVSSIHTADIDGDGDIDVVAGGMSAIAGGVVWFENIDGKGGFGTRNNVMSGIETRSVYVSDIDNDGDMDILSASGTTTPAATISWFENTDGKGNFGEEQIIAQGNSSVYAADIDADGDMDVIYGSINNTFAWSENTDGAGSFGISQVITTATLFPTSVYVADIDGDNDMDVLSASLFDDKVAWYENTDGNGTFGQQNIIDIDGFNPSAVFAADIDGDGDVDVLSSTLFRVIWYENLSTLPDLIFSNSFEP